MPDRRTFLKKSLGISLAATTSLSVPQMLRGADSSPTDSQTAPSSSIPLPRRKLGRNGPEVTILAQGGSMAPHSPTYLELTWQNGIRYFDASHVYLNGKCEQNINQFLKHNPDRRKDLFIVTKDHSFGDYRELLGKVDARLSALGTDYIDLFFIHGIGPDRYGENSVNWPRDPGFKTVCDQLKASGKVKMLGFSCHDGRLIEYLESAADGGFLDALMIAHDPFHEKGGAYDKALDACHRAGIGLVAMKSMRAVEAMSKRLPELDAEGLTVHQAVLHAIWADPRFSSIVCEMDNVSYIEANAVAARTFTQQYGQLSRQSLKKYVSAYPHQFCPGCDSCMELAAQTGQPFLDVARYVSYYERDGKPEAGKSFQELKKIKGEFSGQVFARAAQDCQYQVDFPEILKRAERYFG